jgi:hypothetical protein
MLAGFDLVPRHEIHIPFGAEQVAPRPCCYGTAAIRAVSVQSIIRGVCAGAILHRRITLDCDEVRAVRVGGYLNQTFHDSLDPLPGEEIPGACLQRSGVAVHDLKEAVRDGGEEGRVIGITRIDLNDDLEGGAVGSADGPLCERQRVVVDGEIADGDIARTGDQQCRSAGRIDERSPVAIELELIELLEEKGGFDLASDPFVEIQDDMTRLAGFARLGGRFGNRGQGFWKSSVGIEPGAGEARHLENGCTSSGLGLRFRADTT